MFCGNLCESFCPSDEILVNQKYVPKTLLSFTPLRLSDLKEQTEMASTNRTQTVPSYKRYSAQQTPETKLTIHYINRPQVQVPVRHIVSADFPSPRIQRNIQIFAQSQNYCTPQKRPIIQEVTFNLVCPNQIYHSVPGSAISPANQQELSSLHLLQAQLIKQHTDWDSLYTRQIKPIQQECSRLQKANEQKSEQIKILQNTIRKLRESN